MNISLYNQDARMIVSVLFILMLVFRQLGRVVGRKMKAGIPTDSDDSSVLLSSVFALSAFILGFTFSMSAGRFDIRRQSKLSEANAIGTALLRCDLYNDSVRGELRKDFKNYLEARIAYHDAGINQDRIELAIKQADSIGGHLWKITTALSRNGNDIEASRLLIPALNDMFDSATSRHFAFKSKVPETIIWMLLILSVTSSFFSGYTSSNKKVDHIATVAFCCFTCLVIYITLDLDRPRTGLINTDDAEQEILNLRTQFN